MEIFDYRVATNILCYGFVISHFRQSHHYKGVLVVLVINFQKNVKQRALETYFISFV